MKYTENEKQQLRDFVKEGLGRVVSFLHQTKGLPAEITIEKINEMKTTGEQMAFLDNFSKKHPSVFKDMPLFVPNTLV